VSFLRKGLSANFGGIGKGFALDKAARMLQNSGLAEALLHGGHSSIYAFGDPTGSGRGWQVTIRHPLEPEVDFAAVWLDSMGMATSGAGEQHFSSQGKRYGHVIDPRYGRPVEHHLSATALAPTAALSDALSTAFFIMSLDEVEAFCSKSPDVGAVIVPSVEEGDPLVYRFGIATSCVDPIS
jgi:thiamine biosynthesis lipoprotein